MYRLLILFHVLILIGVLRGQAVSPPDLEPGLIVVAVVPDSPAAQAGVQVGDVLLTYAGTPLVFVSSLNEAREKASLAPQENVTVELRRGEEIRTVTLPAGKIGVEARPPLPAGALALWEAGRARAKQAAVEKAEQWQAAAEAAQQAGDARAAAWLEREAGGQWQAAQRFDQAAAAYAQAAALSQATGDARGTAEALSKQGIAAYNRGDLAVARESYQRALVIYERRVPDSLAVAASLTGLGNVARRQGALDEAQAYHRRALVIRERLAPDSLDVALSLTGLGNVACQQGDLPGAREYHQRALVIRERLAPDSLDVAASLGNLGIVAWYQGDLAGAQDYFQRALVMRERRVPDSLDVASSLGNLGLAAADQGDLAGAREYHQRALAIFEQRSPNSLDVAASLNNLGTVAFDQGDLAGARGYFQRALAIYEWQAPDSLAVALSLNNLGTVAGQQGDLAGAREYHQRALAMRERLASNSLDVANSLSNLGNVADQQGDLAGAKKYYQRALAIQERLAPDSLAVALSLDNLGNVAFNQGDLAGAREYYQRALAIKEQWSPDSLAVARSLTGLGIVTCRQGDLGEAIRWYRRGLRLAQDQGGREETVDNSWGLGYTRSVQGDLEGADEAYQLCLDTLDEWRTYAGREAEEQAGLWSQYTSPFLEYAALLLYREQPAAAFHVSERGKARALLDTLGQRETGLSPEEVRQEADLERELAVSRKALERLQEQPDADKDALQQQNVATVTARQALETFRQALYERHPDLRAQRGELQPLTGEQVTGMPLSPEALVLSFLVGEKETLVFVLHRPTAEKPVELTVQRLAGKAEELAEAVRDVRGALRNPRRADSGAARAALRRLSDALLTPLGDLLRPGQQLLLCPDGFLWDVPWAALPLPGREEPLITEHAVSVVPSVTVLDWLLRRPSRKREAPRLLAVGANHLDWARTEEVAEPVQVAQAPHGLDFLRRVRDGTEREPHQLPPLQQAEAEAQSLGDLYAPEAEVLVGEAATEGAVKARLVGPTVLHFATHGVIDDGLPMQSGLLLNRGAEGQEDGRLTARELLRLNLTADVAVLSACQTARGRRENGEGILGLSWAFAAAGVSQTVVSQWEVADDSTAALMAKFHEGLRGGLSVAEALRQAQWAVRSEGQWTSPYHWAAFVVMGTGQ